MKRISGIPSSSKSLFCSPLKPLALAFAVAAALSPWVMLSAEPKGGRVVGGEGSISQDGSTTTVNQDTDRLVVNWDSFDVGVDERVHFIQPDDTSIALNRILGSNGSQILGRIDANGHVILVNPNGIIFGKDAQINVGGMLASGLSIDPSDFLNGDYTFSALEGTEGSVINRGLLNASVGGSIALLGRTVENHGLISADLGAVTLASGNQAVLTFDNEGLMGLRVTEAVLQEQLGVDPALVNSGDIHAAGGRVLLTASVSEDIFSRAVNRGDMSLDSSVVVHEDGSFTLGEGADVLNSGSIVTSSGNDGGDVVVLGDNVTSTGNIHADILQSSSTDVSAGNIEIHSVDTSLLLEDSVTSANAVDAGRGGDVKVLGTNVGLADNAQVQASGENGGGQVLIGGDRTGSNPRVRNAQFIYLGEGTQVNTDAFALGNGGRLITFAENTARIYGGLSAVGGALGGDGGFIETSGLESFEIPVVPDVTASNGFAGEWLIDPYNVGLFGPSGEASEFSRTQNGSQINFTAVSYGSIGSTAWLSSSQILSALAGGATVTISTNINPNGPDSGNIETHADLNYTSLGTRSTLNLEAAGSITINHNIAHSFTNNFSSLNVSLEAGGNIGGTGSIVTHGGSFSAIAGGGYLGGGLAVSTTPPLGQGLSGAVTIEANGGSAVLGAISGGAISVNALNDISDSGRVAGGGGTFRITGAARGDIALDNRPYLNIVNVYNADEFSYLATDTRDLDIGALNANTAFIDVQGRVRDIGAPLSITGVLDISVRNTDDIIFNSTGGNFGSVYIRNANDVTLFDINNITVYTSSGSASSSVNNLNVTAGSEGGAGDIYDGSTTNALVVRGRTTLAATRDIYLDGAGTDLAEVDIISAASVGITENNGLTFGDIRNVSSDFLVSTNNGDINQRSGSVIDLAGGAATRSISLSSGGVARVLSLDGQNRIDRLSVSASGSSVYINTDTPISISATANSLELIANGDITQANRHLIAGSAVYNAGAGNVLLESTSNNFGSVSVTGAAAARIVDVDAIEIGQFLTSSPSGSSSIRSGGQITFADSVVVPGSLTLSPAADTDLALVNPANDIRRLHVTAGRNLSLNTVGNLGLFDTSTPWVLTGDAILNVGGDLIFETQLGSSPAPNTGVARNAAIVTGGDVLFEGGGTNLQSITGTLDLDAGGDVAVYYFDTFGGDFRVQTAGSFVVGGSVRTSGGVIDVNAQALIDGGTFQSSGGNITLQGTTGVDATTIASNGTAGGGNISLDSSGAVNVLTLRSRGSAGTTDGFDGGDINVAGNTVVLRSIDVSGGAAGDALSAGGDAGQLTVVVGGDSPSIELGSQTLAGLEVLNAEGGVGSSAGVSTISSFTLSGTAGTPGRFAFYANDYSLSSISVSGNASPGSLDTLSAPSHASEAYWQINAVGGGSVSNVENDPTPKIIFENFEILQGGEADDQFMFLPGGVITSEVQGGAGDNTIVARTSENIWEISDSGAGLLRLTSESAATAYLRQFSEIQNVIGGDAGDTFVFSSAGSISGAVNGRDGTDTADYSALTVVNVNLSGTLNIENMEIVRGNGVDSTLIAATGTNIWSITGVNDGDIQGSFAFEDFNNITGGAGNDEFRFAAAGSITGTLDGGAGVNTLQGRDATSTWTIDGANSGVVRDAGGVAYVNNFDRIQHLIGQSGDDTFTFGAGVATSSIASITGGVGDDSLTLALGNNLWTLNSNNAGVVSGLTFTGVENLTGGIGDDEFLYNFAGVYSGIVDGGAQVIADVINVIQAGAISYQIGAAAVNGATGFESVIAATGSRLLGSDVAANTWTISGTDRGSLASGGQSLRFQGFSQLVGSDVVADTFTIGTSGVFNGLMQGGSDTSDNRIINSGAALTWTLDDSTPFAGSFGSSGSFTGINTIAGSGNDTLVGRNVDSRWFISGTTSGEIAATGYAGYVRPSAVFGEDFSFSGMLNISGDAAEDIFAFETAVANIGAAGVVDGGNGPVDDVFNLNNITGGMVVVLGPNNTSALNVNNIENLLAPASDPAGNELHNLRAGNFRWDITGPNAGYVEPAVASAPQDQIVSFVNFGTLVGGVGGDSIVYQSGGSLAGGFDGGDGANFLDLSRTTDPLDITIGVDYVNVDGIIGNNNAILRVAGSDTGANSWRILGENDGEFDADSDAVVDFYFFDFNQLVGGVGNDTFEFSDAGFITGQIDGAGGLNTITHAGVTRDQRFRLNGGAAAIADVTLTNLLQITSIAANPARNNTLLGGDVANTWSITAANAGTVGTVTFSGIANLVGGSAIDTFQLNGGSVLTIDGGGSTGDQLRADAGSNTFIISAVNQGQLNAALNFQNVEVLTGGAANDRFDLQGGSVTGSINGAGGENTLNGNDTATTWTISGVDSGALVGVNAFSNIQILEGGTDNDIFQLASDAARVTRVRGGGGVNTLNGVARSSAVTADLAAATMAGIAFEQIQTLAANPLADNTIIAANQANSWTITGSNSGTVAGVTFTGFRNLSGNAGADTFILAGGSVSGLVDGAGGTDILQAADGVNVWNLTGAAAGDLTNVGSFSSVEMLNGGLGSDRFIVGAAGSATQINGGGGDDELDMQAATAAITANLATNVVGGLNVSSIETLRANNTRRNVLRGSDDDTDWNISSANGGSVSRVGVTTQFSGFHDLVGGSGGDSFVFAGGSLAGTVDGGTNIDTLIAGNSINVWTITGANSGTLTDTGGFSGIENLVGNAQADAFVLAGGSVSGNVDGGGGADSLRGADIGNTWAVNTINGGTVTGISGTFVSIETLLGGAGADLFNIADGMRVTAIAGGAGSNTLNLTAATAGVDVNLATGLAAGIAITEIGTVQANPARANTLTAPDRVNDWNLSAANAGSITGLIQFSGFQTLVGNNQRDNFTVLGGSVSGSINGGGGSDFLYGDNLANTWTISGSNSGSALNITNFSGIENLVGNAQADDFVLAGGSVSGSVDGATGSNSLRAADATNVWQISALNAGIVNGVGSFANIQALLGGAGDDTFDFADQASVSSVDGRAGNDTMDLRDYLSPITVDLQNNLVAGMSALSVESVRANTVQNNVLVGQNIPNVWNISGLNTGTLNGTAFEGFATLLGGSAADAFIVAGGSITGALEGQGGIDTLTADNRDNTWVINGLNEGAVTGVNRFVGVENLVGNAQADNFELRGGTLSGSVNGAGGVDSLRANNTLNTWNLSANNSGTVTGVLSFSGVEQLIGGTATDTFVFADGVTVGGVAGEAGNDTLDFRAYTSNIVADLQNGVVAGMPVSGIEVVLANATGDNTLVGGNTANTWDITGLNSGLLNGIGFAGFANLTGGAAADSFVLNGGRVTGVLNGALGADSLSADAVDNSFVITALNEGTATGTGGFIAIENLIGNSQADSFTLAGGSLSGTVDGRGGNDTLTANNIDNTWLINAANAGTVNGLAAFSSIESLNGGNQADSFRFAVASLSGSLNGGDGSDTLIANDSATSVVLNARNGGTMTGIGGTFANVENINGGAADDSFTLNGGSLDGLLDGGAGVNTFTADNVANVFVIRARNAGSATGLAGGTPSTTDGFSNIAYLIGNAQADRFELLGGTLDGSIDGRGGMDTLVADNVANSFVISVANGGSATGVAGGFSGVEHLIGNNDSDSFRLSGGTLAGTITGGLGEDSFFADNVDNLLVLNTLNGGTATGLGAGTDDLNDGFSGIENLTTGTGNDSLALVGGQLSGLFNAGDGMDTLTGDNVANTFVVSLNNGGSATGTGGFRNVENLVGGSADDQFILAGGLLAGVIDGRDGVDSFSANDVANSFVITRRNGGTATGLGGGTMDPSDGFSNIETLIGASQNDSFSFVGGTLDGDISGAAGADTLTADNVANSFSVDAENAGTVTGLAGRFSGIENLVGNAERDTFAFVGGSLTGTVNGAGQSDILSVSSVAGQALTWTVNELNNGSVDGIAGGFQSVENLIGGAGNDSFTLSGAGLVNVNVRGGEGTDTFAVNAVTNGQLSGEGGNDVFNLAANVILQDVLGGDGDDRFNLLQAGVAVAVNGGAGADTLDVVHSADNTWTLNNIDNRVQDTSGGAARFAAVENLLGGDGIDTFNVSAEFTGSIAGEGNDDRFSFNAAVLGGVNGGAGNDRFTLNDIGLSFTIDAGAGLADVLDINHEVDQSVWDITATGNSLRYAASPGLVSFSGVEVLQGHERVDTFNVLVPFSGRLVGEGAGDVFNLSARVEDGDERTYEISGGAGNDRVNVLALNVSATVDGGEGVDEIYIEHGFDTRWEIEGEAALFGNRVMDASAGGVLRFVSVENGFGGAGVDRFNIAAEFTGTFSGRGNNDIFNVAANVINPSPLAAELFGDDGDDQFNLASASLSLSIDGGAGLDVLDVQHGQDATWTLSMADGNAVSATANPIARVAFTAMETLLGSSAVDNFVVTAAFAGSLDGRESNDTFDLRANVLTEVNGGFGDDRFVVGAPGLSLQLNGGDGNDTVTANLGRETTWTLDALNNRFIETGSAAAGTRFRNIELAVGGTDVDVFDVSGLFVGRIDGSAGDDIFNLSAAVTDGNGVTADILGGQGNDTVNLLVAGLVLSIDGGEGDGDQLNTLHNAANTWALNTVNSTVGSASFTNVESLRGNDQSDSVTVNSAFNGRVFSQGGNDTFVLNANVSDGLLQTVDVNGGAGDDSFLIGVAGLSLSISGDAGSDTISVDHLNGSLWQFVAGTSRVDDATFTGVEAMRGGEGVDTFNINAVVDGFIEGRGGDDVFNLGADVLTVVRGGAGNDRFNVMAAGLSFVIDGESGSDSLAIDAANTASYDWTVRTNNSEVRDAMGTGLIAFNNVEELFGGVGVDRFTVESTFIGRIDGGASADVFTFNATVSDNNVTTVDVFGGAGDDLFDVVATGLRLSLDAGGGVDTLLAPNQENRFVIGSSNTLNADVSGTVGVRFAAVENFTGNAQADHFVLEPLAQVNILRGTREGVAEQGRNTLTLQSNLGSTTRWRIDGLDTGFVLDGRVARFIGMHNLTGGQGADEFGFVTLLADISGLIDGASGGDPLGAANDSLLLSGLTNGVVVELGSDISSDNLHVINVERIVAVQDTQAGDGVDSEARNHLINNRGGDYNWTISGRNTGNVAPALGAGMENTVAFEYFGTLEAGSGEDSFRFLDGGVITGSIIGGDGGDTADFSSSTGAIDITVSDGQPGSIGLSGFSLIIGNNSGLADTLPNATLRVSGSSNNDWLITNVSSAAIADVSPALNDGQLDSAGLASTITFVNFNHVVGGAGEDHFRINGDARISGSLSGGDNSDRLSHNGLNAGRGLELQVGGDVFGRINVAGIERLEGSESFALSNVLWASEASNVWTIAGTNAGDLNGVNFVNFANLNGTSGVDSFLFDGTDHVQGLIDGRGGASDRVDLSGLADGEHRVVALGNRVSGDTAVLNIVNVETLLANAANDNRLIADNRANLWRLSAANAGRVEAAQLATEDSSTNFSGFNQLQGGTGDDEFRFTAAGRYNGMIDGGDGSDLVNLLTVVGDVRLGLGDSAVADIRVRNIERANASNGAASNNTLVADLSNNAWLIDARNGGSLNETLLFSGFRNLEGRDFNDTFVFTANGRLEGYIDGSAQRNEARDIVDMRALSAVNVALGNEANDLRNVERVIGNNLDSTLTARVMSAEGLGNTWVIAEGDSENSGLINGSIEFIGFNNLVGSSADDSFYFRAENPDARVGRIRGLIDGAAGNDLLAVNVDQTGSDFLVTFNGGLGDDRIDISGDLTGYAGRYTPGALNLGGRETLVYEDSFTAARVSFDYLDAESVNDALRADSLVINGTSERNVFSFGDNSVTVSVWDESRLVRTFSTLNFSAGGDADNIIGKENLSVDAGIGDRISLVSNLDVAGALTVNGVNTDITVDSENASVRAGSLVLNDVRNVASAAAPLVTELDRLSVQRGMGSVFIAERDALVIDALAVSGELALSLREPGAVTSSANLSATGDVSITTVLGDILLTGMNNFQGEISLVAPEQVVRLNNQGEITLAQLRARDLMLNAGGAIRSTDEGSTRVTGAAQLIATGDIRFANANHGFSVLSIGDAADVTLIDSDGMGLRVSENGIRASGDVSLASTSLQVDGAMAANAIALRAEGGNAVIAAVLDTRNADQTGGDIAIDAAAVDIQAGVFSDADLRVAAQGNVRQAADIAARGNVAIHSAEGSLTMEENVAIDADSLTLSAGEHMQLATIRVNSLELNAVGDVLQRRDISVGTGSANLGIGGDFSMLDDTHLLLAEGGLDLNASGDVDLMGVAAQGDIRIASSAGEIDINRDIASAEGAVTVAATGRLRQFGGVSAQSGVTLSSAQSDVDLDAEVRVITGDISISAGAAIDMATDMALRAETGNVSLSAGGDIALGLIEAGGAQQGVVTLDSSAGAIRDINGGEENVRARRLVADAATGIGAGNGIETSVDSLSAGNETNAVHFINSGAVAVDRLHNNGDITLVAREGDIVIDNRGFDTYDTNATDYDANLAGGIIDANHAIGTLNVRADNGNIRVAEQTSGEVPVVVAYNAYFDAPNGQTGASFRRISAWVQNEMRLRGYAAAQPLFPRGKAPRFFFNDAEFKPDLAALLLQSGDLLVDVEPIETINPAVFSAVRNYAHDQVAILMPADQRYEDEEDEYEDY